VNICTACNGTGQTKEGRTVIKQVEPKVWKTTAKGSGCLTCLGTGIIGKRRVYPGLDTVRVVLVNGVEPERGMK